MEKKNLTEADANESTDTLRRRGKNPPPSRPEKHGRQGKGPERTGEGDSSVERGQRAGPPSRGGGSQWPHRG